MSSDRIINRRDHLFDIIDFLFKSDTDIFAGTHIFLESNNFLSDNNKYYIDWSKPVSLYKVDNEYNKQSEGGILYSDETLNINWQILKGQTRVSDKDVKLPTFLSL